MPRGEASQILCPVYVTAGYHQAPLQEDSRRYTALVTYMEIFEWYHVQIGLKGAPSYFQGVSASVIPIGLLYFVCD